MSVLYIASVTVPCVEMCGQRIKWTQVTCVPWWHRVHVVCSQYIIAPWSLHPVSYFIVSMVRIKHCKYNIVLFIKWVCKYSKRIHIGLMLKPHPNIRRKGRKERNGSMLNRQVKRINKDNRMCAAEGAHKLKRIRTPKKIRSVYLHLSSSWPHLCSLSCLTVCGEDRSFSTPAEEVIWKYSRLIPVQWEAWGTCTWPCRTQSSKCWCASLSH